ncbi:MAG: phosphatidylglycerol lysyltransferase domain-containing protein [Patescibacteria group bacterium]
MNKNQKVKIDFEDEVLKNIIMGIPIFPVFKNLELEHKEEIERITKQFPPYSDYNFVSLWTYNVKNNIKIARLNDNIVIRFCDYISNEPFYSFLGNKKVLETVDALLKHAKKENIVPKLKLIPEENIVNNPKLFNFFQINEDRDNFDYIYSTEEIKLLQGSKYQNKRKMANRFKREYPQSSFLLQDLKDQNIQRRILNVFFIWERNKGKNRKETNHELTAIKRLFKSTSFFNLLCFGVHHRDELKGFLILELIHEKHSIFHFIKADPLFRGIFEFIYMSTAQELHKREYTYINREQDLGIAGLRQAKTSWHPLKFLKKYIISPKD